MHQSRNLGRFATRASITLGMILAAAVPLTAAAPSHAATNEALSVDLAAGRGPSTLVGEGVLYGINQDATLPADQHIQPLKLNAFRGGGWFSGGWIKDNYQYGAATQADITSIIAQARRLNQVGNHPQYQVLLSDLYGLNGGQPSNTVYPCDNGNCANWATFIDTTVAALQASGLPFAYDIDNEPDISVFWKAGVNSTQYFQMWDTAHRELRRVAPIAQIVGPSFAYTPQARPQQWSTFLNHVKAAGTVPDWIANHDEGDVDDPVTVSQALNSQLSAAGIAARPLSANEYQPADRQTAGVTAWYLARFAQSSYTNAMRGNWVCCMTPNLTGILTQTNGAWTTSGNWWAMRAYADMTGTLVNTSGQVGSTAISASIDSTNRRAVAILGDSNGYTGSATVTFNGVSANSWLAGNGSVTVTVDRIPDQATLNAPQVVLNQTMTVSGGAVTVPLTFQSSHDAFAVYVTPATTSGQQGVEVVGGQSGRCVDVPGASTANGTQTQLSDCSGASSQRWTYTSGKQLQVYGSKCLDANGHGTTNGTAVIIYDCNGQANQQWTINSNGTITGVQSGLCLDANGAGTASGTKLILWTCNGGANQQWSTRA
ncbi:RICIN domain-containing protein [Actinoplanes sp. N902-109]|uniref:RICIN domain-containing protein n=1 Tax=Actinoplanes sp. (strain N902-109) TaxID=649831 RepID=UPI0003296444|nr:RICIN domain-containing protein [Actinoplanes sp. N902-109]AGL16193.1 beta-xylosidase [Actinoplanes sp. N902-109]